MQTANLPKTRWLYKYTIKYLKQKQEGHVIMIKWSLDLEAVTVMSIHAPNNRAPKYMK